MCGVCGSKTGAGQHHLQANNRGGLLLEEVSLQLRYQQSACVRAVHNQVGTGVPPDCDSLRLCISKPDCCAGSTGVFS